MDKKAKISRREMLKLAGLWSGGALLSACAPKGTPTPVPAEPTPTPPPQPTATPTVPAIKKPVTVNFWYARSHPDPAAEEAYWLEMVSKFEAENPGIKVEWIPQSWSDLFTKIVAVIESGDTPDICMTGFKNLSQYAVEGELLPLDDVVERLGGADALKPLDNFYVWDGHWWGLPNTEGTNMFYYRKDLLEEVGFDGPPQDWDELVEAAKALTTEDRYGLDLYYSMTHTVRHLVYAFMVAADGGNVGRDEKPMMTDPNTVKAIEYYTALLTEHKVIPPSRIVDTDFGASTMPAYGAGKVAMFGYSSGTYGALEKDFPEIWKNTGVSVFPKGPSGHSGHCAYINPLWMFAKSKHPDEAKQFLEFLQTREATIGRARLYASPLGGARGYAWIKEVPELWQSPTIQTTIEALPHSADGFFPYGNHPVAGKADGLKYIETMIQDIVVNGVPVEEACANANEVLQGLLDEYHAQHG